MPIFQHNNLRQNETSNDRRLLPGLFTLSLMIATAREIRVELVSLKYLGLSLPLQLLLLVWQKVILEPGDADHAHHTAHDDSSNLNRGDYSKKYQISGLFKEQ